MKVLEHVYNQERRQIMPHSHQKKLLRRLSPFELEKEVDRRKSRIHLFQVRDEIIQDAPEIFECEEFKRVKKHPSVSWFIRSFWQCWKPTSRRIFSLRTPGCAVNNTSWQGDIICEPTVSGKNPTGG